MHKLLMRLGSVATPDLILADKIGHVMVATGVLHNLKHDDVTIVRQATIREITAAGVHYEQDGTSHMVQADQVIIAMGVQTDTRLADDLNSRGIATSVADD